MSVDQVTGKLWFVFYDRRNYSDTRTDVYLAMSDDGGETFENFKVSDSPFIPNPGIFFGDYNNISAHNDVVRPIWTRLHQNQLGIYTAIVDTELVGVPDNTGLLPLATIHSWPNPFSQTTAFSYKLRRDAQVTLLLRDITGRRVTTFIDNKHLPAGKYVQQLDGAALKLGAGVYFFELVTSSGKECKKVVYAP